MKSNLKWMVFCAFLLAGNNVILSQTEQNSDKSPVERTQRPGYNECEKKYVFEVETFYILSQQKEAGSVKLLEGTGKEVELLNLEPGTYWMFQTKEDGQGVMDRFYID